MSKQITMSAQTRINWLIDAALFLGALVAMLSGIYFLYFPSGGYQGGRNPAYGVTILFERSTWDVIHTWGGVAMIAAVAVHFTYHWSWVKVMAKRVANTLRPTATHTSKGAWLNLGINTVVVLSFLVCAVSGIYFLYTPSGGYQGGNNAAWDTVFVFDRTTWDVIHTWSGVTLIAAAVIHFAIHWRWVTKVTSRFFRSLGSQPVAQPVTVTE